MGITCLAPLLVIDGVSKVRAFARQRTKLTWVGLLNAICIAALFYTIATKIVPSEEAVKQPITVKGKVKVAAAEVSLAHDCFVGAAMMLGVNLALLVLPIVELGLKQSEAARAKAAKSL